MRGTGYFLFIALIVISFSASAQDVREAYNLSDLSVQGTARSMGFGNALGSVGGDFGSLSVNPAGIGVYRNSEISITPSVVINNTTGEYSGVNSSSNTAQFSLNNFGIVFTNAAKGRRYKHRKWKTVAFAIGMNRVADFNNDVLYQGKTSTSSVSQVFESDANMNPNNVTTLNNSYGSLGYNSYLLNKNTSGQYESIVPFSGGVDQVKGSQSWGGIDEFNMSFGGNFKEKLLLGITIGAPIVNYQDNSYFQETLDAGNTNSNPYGFNSLDYSQSLNVTGAGINAKIGAIYKISDIFRIGAAFHTPTYYSLTDESSQGISVVHNDSLGALYGPALQNRFDYNLTTPWKGVISGTIILNKLGFITADYEYVDYSTMRYTFQGGIDNSSPTGASYQQEADALNQVIQKTYKAASDFRIGGEAVIAKYFMVRLGFGYYGNAYTPYGESTANSYYTTQRIDVSAGVGLHFRHFFTDLGFIHSMYQGYEQPYSVVYNNGAGTSYVFSGSPATVPTAKIDFSLNNLAWTVGVKF